MNVLLINPRYPSARLGRRRYRRAWPPLDLLNLAARLRDMGAEVKLLDLRARPEISWDQAIERGRAADVVVLQTTPLDRWQCPDLNVEPVLDQAARLPAEKLVLAGAHGSVRPNYVLERSQARFLVVGEPETAVSQLAAHGMNPEGIPGIIIHKNGETVIGPPPKPAPLDDGPPPAYDLIDLADYQYELLGPRLALLETSRGCPYGCAFCLKAVYGTGVRYKSLDRVLTDYERAVELGRAQSVYFMDLEFTVARNRALALCDGIMAAGRRVDWCCQTRADAVDAELLGRMRAAGCRLIHFGVETASPRLMERIGKKLDLDRVRTAVEECRRLGIRTACFFLFGLPGETEADRAWTVDFARRLNPTYASFHPAAPYPQTVLAAGASSSDRCFAAATIPEHDERELGRSVRRAIRSFYLRPSYLRARWTEGGNRWARIKLFWDLIR
jgi:hypothetical protein